MKVFLTALCLQTTVTKLIPNCFMATWRWCEKTDLQVTYRHSSNLADVERKHDNSDWGKTNFERSQGDEMPQNSQEWLSAFSENESLKSESKDYCQLENFLFFRLPIPNISRQRFSFTRPRIANKLELPGFSYLLFQPWHSSDDGSDSAVGQNVGFFKTLGLCPRYFQAETYHHSCESKIIEYDAEDARDGACTASWQLHLDKSLQNASKDTEAPAKQLHCAKMLHVVVEWKNICYLAVGQWLCDFGVNFRRVTAAKQQWLHVGPDQVLKCNAKLLPLMQR